MREIPIPRDVSSDTQRSFQEVNRVLKQQEVPLLKDMTSVRGIAEHSSAYFKRDDGILCRYTKIDGELYCEELPRVSS